MSTIEDIKTGYNKREPIIRKDGVTASERYLLKLCENSFLSLWSYSGIYSNRGKNSQGLSKEVCDLLVIFQNNILIFSDKYCEFPDSGKIDVDWKRWHRKAIKNSEKQILGAERWIAQYPERLFLDVHCTQPFPIKIPDFNTAKFFRIIVAHGAKERCQAHLGGDGSLLLQSLESGMDTPVNSEPFKIVQFTNQKFVHILDSYSLDIIFNTLDTITDFVNYLEKKEIFFKSGIFKQTTTETNLLAHYLQTTDSKGEHNFLLGNENESLIPPNDLWGQFKENIKYQRLLQANQNSYIWDQLLDNFSQHLLSGTHCFYSTDPSTEIVNKHIMPEPILRFLASEPRLVRRVLAEGLIEKVKEVPLGKTSFRIAYVPFFDHVYVFVVIAYDEEKPSTEKWLLFLPEFGLLGSIRHPKTNHVISIGIAKDVKTGIFAADNLVYLDCQSWTKKQKIQIRRRVKSTKFYENAKTYGILEQEFRTNLSSRFFLDESFSPQTGKLRYYPCPCGSGLYYKDCHALLI